MRGYFYFLLFKQWGGVPLITSVLDPGDESQLAGITRASAEQTLQRVLDDKFKETRLTPLPGSQVAAPLVAECPLGLECKVAQTVELGSHTLFLAEIVAVQVSEEFVNASGRLELEKAGLAAYIHGHYHRVGDAIGHFGYSVRKKPGPVVRR